MSPVQVSLIAEGHLDEGVLRQIITQTTPHLLPTICYGKRGRDWMRINLSKYNNAANTIPFVALADLEQDLCPPSLIRSWFPQGVHANMRPRIAVRMVESWLLADREACAEFLGIPTHHIPHTPDNEPNPKLLMVNLARHSRLRIIREDIVPSVGSSGRVGKNYHGQMEKFINQRWNAERAMIYSPSLVRTINSLQNFHPPTA